MKNTLITRTKTLAAAFAVLLSVQANAHNTANTTEAPKTNNPAESKTVNLMVDGLPGEEGTVWVLIYDQQADFVGEKESAVAFYELNANQSRQQLEIKDLELGSYAILIYYDRNGNGQLDKNWSGRPLEDYVYSSLDKFTGLPSFSEAAIEVDESTHAIYLKLNKVKAKGLAKKVEKKSPDVELSRK